MRFLLLWACPMCKETLLSQNDPALASRLTQGYAWSIALLMAAPYLLFLAVTLAIVRSARRAKTKRGQPPC